MRFKKVFDTTGHGTWMEVLPLYIVHWSLFSPGCPLCYLSWAWYLCPDVVKLFSYSYLLNRIFGIMIIKIEFQSQLSWAWKKFYHLWPLALNSIPNVVDNWCKAWYQFLLLLFITCQTINVICKAQVCDFPSSNVDSTLMVRQCFWHNPFQQDIEESRWQKTALSDSNSIF